MKKLLLFLFIIFSLPAFSQSLEMLIFPKYIHGGSTGVNYRIPYVYRAKLTGLKSNKIYRYSNKLVPAASTSQGAAYYLYVLPPANVLPGTPDHNATDFYRPELSSDGTTNGAIGGGLDADYGVFTTDDSGSYTGWFIQETVQKRSAGLKLLLRISLNDPDAADPTAIAYKLHSPTTQPLYVVDLDSEINPDGVFASGTAIRSTAATGGIPKNFVFLYNDAEGLERPVAGTLIEDDGVTGNRSENLTSGYAPFYFDHVNGTNGTWGTMILNSDLNGIHRIEQRSLTTGEIVGYNTSTDGSWTDGANPGNKVSTVNVNLGTSEDGNTAIVIDGSIVTLEPVKNPQTVAFTNTFQPVYNIGDVITLTANSSAGLTAFQYTAAPAGILEITGNTAKVIGAGTAIITVTEPGNATTGTASATHSVTVNGTPQAITNFPVTLTGTYGDANLTLAAVGGASGNPVIYTSSDATIAEITAGNQIIFKKAGTVTIKANQAGNTTYSPATELSSTLTIAKAVLDVIAEDKIKTQGGVNPEATFVYGEFKNSDDASAVTGTPVLTVVADASSRPGVYDILVDVQGLTSEKYTFNPVKGKLTVEAKKDQIITFENFPATATYGDQSIPFQVRSNTSNEITFSSSNINVATIAKNAIGEWAVTIKGAGEANITAAQAEDATYVPGKATQHITVSPALLTITADDKAKLSGEADPVFTVRYEGFVNNETQNNLTGTLSYTKEADGTGFLIVPAGLTSINYAITFVKGKLTEGNVAFAAINKTYGDAAFNPGARNTANETPAYTIADAAVATMLNGNSVQIQGAGVTNITAAFPNGDIETTSITVAQKAVIITVDSKTRMYAQANPQFTVTYNGLVNGETTPAYTTQPALTTTASDDAPVGKYAITASGAISGNYKFTYVPAVLTITQATLMVKADDQSKIYGQANPALTITYTGLAAHDNGDALNLQTVIATAATAASKVGTYPITLSGLANTTNYRVTYTGGLLSVTPAPLNIKADDIEKALGQLNPTFTFTYTGFVNNDEAGSLITAPTAATTATESSPKGVYPITVSGASAADYTITYTAGQLSIKDVQTVQYNDLPAATYGDASFNLVASSHTGLTPVFTSDNLNVAIIENGKVKIIGAGTANISATFPATSDFIAVTITKPLIVAKRPLLVRADSKNRIYGQANPILTAVYEGFVNNETQATAIAAPAVITTEATLLSPAGTYPIIGNGASALNYEITYEAGVMTIDKAVLTVTADNKSRTFGAENPEFTFKYKGFVNAENPGVIETPPVGTSIAGADSPAGTYSIVLADAFDENYTFNYVNGTLTVLVSTRTITMEPIPVKSVGDADFVPVIVLNSGETPVLSSSDDAIATIVNNKIHITGAGNVTIKATAPESINYTSTPSVSQLLVVSKVAQTITFEAVPSLKTAGTYTLKAKASSGLPVIFTSSDPSHLSLNGDQITALRIGKTQISAAQAGNNQYAAAKIVVQDILVADADGEGIKVHPALSINGDGMNEFLTIDGIKDFPLNKVTIINRTGIKVFDIEGYDNDQHVFMGKSKSGSLLPQGTYFCLVEYNADSKVKRKTGYFILKY